MLPQSSRLSLDSLSIVAGAVVILAACSPSERLAPSGEFQETYPPPTPDLSTLPTAFPLSPIDFVSEAGQFTVTFPCCDLARSALNQHSITEAPFDQKVDCEVTVLPEDGASWKVEYCDLPPSLVSIRSVEETLEWARDDEVQDARAHIAEERSLSPNFEASAQGLSVVGPANMRGILLDGTFKARVYLVGTRVYRVSARVYNENWGNRLAMIDPFLDSFFIHSALTIPFEPTPTPP